MKLEGKTREIYDLIRDTARGGEPVCQRTLAATIGLSPSAVNYHIAKLRKGGYVDKDLTPLSHVSEGAGDSAASKEIALRMRQIAGLIAEDREHRQRTESFAQDVADLFRALADMTRAQTRAIEELTAVLSQTQAPPRDISVAYAEKAPVMGIAA